MSKTPTPSEQLDAALTKQNKALEQVNDVRRVTSELMLELRAALEADDSERFHLALNALQKSLEALDGAERDLLATGIAMMQSAVGVETDAMQSVIATWSDGYAAGYEIGRALADDAERESYRTDLQGADWFEE